MPSQIGDLTHFLLAELIRLMSLRTLLISLILLLLTVPSWGEMEAADPVLRVYGPGGPHHVMRECAELYRQLHGVPVAVIRAMPNETLRRLREDGDIYYGGADNMLVDLVDRDPALIDLATMEELHPRRIGILVRKGNPLKIRCAEDLAAENVDLLVVKLERMGLFHPETETGFSNLGHLTFTGQQGVEAWREREHLDAWVTYKTWYQQVAEETEFVDLSHLPGGTRALPIALTSRTTKREAALHFIDFLKSAPAREVFEEHGWL